MAPWDFCSMPKGVGELGLIDVMTQVYIGYFVDCWVPGGIHSMENSFPASVSVGSASPFDLRSLWAV